MAKTLSFEQRLARLQEIVEKLSTEEIPLEQSVTLFSEGQALAKACGEQLAKARQEVKLLSPDGETLPFNEQMSEEY